ncbi:MAG: hypothetical protein KDM91_16725 [Verrucomicrobiae bacterium]|nr:hypothetical protein [Verrucomicrobiae bacterium]MCP5550523.1 hypothetical protein [Akkermansiaceae bacterium]
MPPKYRPSLITILGPEFFLLNRLPEDIVELPDYEQMREVGRLVRECYANDRRCQLIGYEYRRSLHEVFHFGVDGEFLGRIEEPPVECEAFVRIGNRTIKTPCSLLFGGGGN